MFRLPRLRKFLGDNKGTAAVEFVMVAPIYLAAVLSVFESGWLMTKNMMLERGLDLTIREIRLGVSGNTEHDQFKQTICDFSRILRDCEETMVLEVTPISTAADIPNGNVTCTDRTTPDAPDLNFSIGNRSDIMYVRACVIVDPIVPGLGLGLQLPKDASGGFQMIAYSAFVNEPS